MKEYAKVILEDRFLPTKKLEWGITGSTCTKESLKTVKHCEKCQRFANVSNKPLEELTHVLSPWPLAQWGVDIIGLLPPRKGGGVKLVVVVIEYFKNWVKAKALAHITIGIED